MNAFLTILQALPAIIAVLKALEAAVPGQGQGKAKLDAAIELITAADAALAQYVPQLTNVIGTLVALFNRVGSFQGGATTTT